jgi:hypothetical protein
LLDDHARADATELLLRAEQSLEGLADRQLRFRIATALAWFRFDVNDNGAGQRLLDLLAESRRLGGSFESLLLHCLTIWRLSNDPAEALSTAEACEAAGERSGNDISRAHGAELRGLALTANRQHADARRHLGNALEVLVGANHLGCALHCMESIAWWAGASGRNDEALELLGLAVALRRSLGRQRRGSIEDFGYNAAIASCGEPTPPSGDDLLADALHLAGRLVNDAHHISPLASDKAAPHHPHG